MAARRKALYSSGRYCCARCRTTLGWGGDRVKQGTGLDPGRWNPRVRVAVRVRVEQHHGADRESQMAAGFLLIGSIVAIALVAWHLWSRPTTPTARELSLRFEAVRSMSGAQFEVFTADLFRAMGHQAVVLGGAGDQGVDVIVNRRGERVAV